jgi:hypothetical protein
MRVAFAPIATGTVTLVAQQVSVTSTRKLNGSGSATAEIVTNGQSELDALLKASAVWGSVMLILSDDMRTCIWAGPVTRREITTTTQKVTIGAEEWEAWLARVWCEPHRVFAGSWLDWGRFATATGWYAGSTAAITDPNWQGMWRNTTGEAFAAIIEAVAVRANRHPVPMPIKVDRLRSAVKAPVGVPFQGQWSTSPSPHVVKTKAWDYAQEIIDQGSDVWIEPAWSPGSLHVDFYGMVGIPYRIGHANKTLTLGIDFSSISMVEQGEQQATVWFVAGRGAAYGAFPPEADPAFDVYRVNMLLDGEANYETRPVETTLIPVETDGSIKGAGGATIPTGNALNQSEQEKMQDRAIGLWYANANTPMSVEQIVVNMIYASDTQPEWSRWSPWFEVAPGDIVTIYIPEATGEWWADDRTFTARVMEVTINTDGTVQFGLTRDPEKMPGAARRLHTGEVPSWQPQRSIVGNLRRISRMTGQAASMRP